MSAERPSLDDLIRAQRSGVGMTSTQRTANRARLTSRVLAQVAVTAAGAAATTASVGSAGAATAWLAKAALGLVLVGGIGAAYMQVTDSAPAGRISQRTATEQRGSLSPKPSVAAPAALSAAAEPTAAVPDAASSPAPAALRVPKASSAAPTPSSAMSLAVEVQLMRDIDAALRARRPERALALLDERREGDGGYMQEERAAARIFALCQLRRVESARAAAARFLRERPRSPLAARVKATCAAPADTAGSGKAP